MTRLSRKTSVNTGYAPLVYLTTGVVIAAVILAIAWPGFMSYDSLKALRGARVGVEDALWPPMVSYIWWVVERIYPGPAGMLFFQNMLLATSITWFLHACGTRLLWAVSATFLTFALPPILGPSLVVWKDVEMAAFLMLGYASYASFLTSKNKRTLIYLCAGSLAIACLVRHNAFFAAIPLIFHWALTRGRPVWRGSLVGTIAVFIICFFPGTFVNNYRLPDLKPISTGQSGVIKSLALHDAIGASVCANLNFFENVMSEPFDVVFLKKNYSARHLNENNNILERVDKKLFDPFDTYRAILKSAPQCLFAHKISMGRFLLGINSGPVYYITHSGIDDNEFGYKLKPSKLRDFVMPKLNMAADTPVAAPATYLLVVISLWSLVAWKSRLSSLHPGITLLIFSGLMAAFTNFFILPAADLRYSYWPLIVWIVASLYLLHKVILMVTSENETKEAKGVC